MDATFSVFIIVNRPRHEVFEAVADPAQLSAYFTTGGAEGRIEAGKTVTWDFHDFPGAFPVEVKDVVADQKIVLEWKANDPGADYNLTVTITFTSVATDRTKVEIEESGWRDTQSAVKASYGNSMG
jgi:uncharacterized protein YndB with AHSA1/START domain